MKYNVSGAHRDTGEEMQVTVEARDFHEAEAKAGSLGLMISSINEHHPDQPHQQPQQQQSEPTPGPLDNVPGVRTIEKTGKIWKAQMLFAALGAIVCFFGLVIFFGLSFQMEFDQPWLQIFGFATAGFVVWYGIVKAMTWWHHG